MAHLLTWEPALLVATICPACSTPHAWNVDPGRPARRPAGRPLPGPAARNVGRRRPHLRPPTLFCNAACAQDWLDRTGNTQGYVMDLRTLWRLASDWYTGRLRHRGYTRREPAAAADYLRSVGLSGPFWGRLPVHEPPRTVTNTARGRRRHGPQESLSRSAGEVVPAVRARPGAAVDADAGSARRIEHRPHGAERRRQRSTPAGSTPAARGPPRRSAPRPARAPGPGGRRPPRAGRSRAPAGPGRGRAAPPRRARHAGGVAEQPVAGVDHRRRAGAGGVHARAVAGRGARWARTRPDADGAARRQRWVSRRRRAAPARQPRDRRGRPAPPRHPAAPRPQHRRMLEHAHRRAGDHDLAGLRDVTARHGGAGPCALVVEPRGQGRRPRESEVPGRGQADDQRESAGHPWQRRPRSSGRRP